MKIRNIQPSEIEECLKLFRKVSKESPWFRRGHKLQPQIDEEINNVKQTLINKKDYCLKICDNKSILGILTTKKMNNLLRIGTGDREPVIQRNKKNFEIGMQLINRAFDYSKEIGLQGIYTTLKEPLDSNLKNNYHFMLFQASGMTLESIGRQLGKRLQSSENNIDKNIAFRELKTENFEAGMKLLHESFESNLEFQYDPLINEYKKLKEFQKKWMDLVDSKQLIAYLNGEPVGYISYKLRIKDNPPTALIGVVGVSSKYRKQKIGKTMLAQVHKELIEKGMLYAYVGTSVHNTVAIKLYKSMGYESLYDVYYFYKVEDNTRGTIIKDKKEKVEEFFKKKKLTEKSHFIRFFSPDLVF